MTFFVNLLPLGKPLYNGSITETSLVGVIEVHYSRTELGKKQETQNNPKLRASEFRLSAFYGAHCRVRRFSVLSYDQWGAQSTF